MATIEERVSQLERTLVEFQGQLHEILHGQSAAANLIDERAAQARQQVADEAELQRKVIQDAADRAARDIGDVNAAVVKVSTGLLTLQQQVTKWAAAGSLAGAVVLFIAVRALGF